MKKIFSLAAVLLLVLGGVSQAFVGGPWDNDNFSETQEDGFYQAVATFPNGSGLMRFAVNVASNGFPTTDQSVWWFQGVTYFGNIFATVDMAARHVAGISTANADVQQAVPEVIPPIGATNRKYLTASWTAKITSTHPQVRFSGSGTMAAFGGLDTLLETTTTNFDVTFLDTGVTVGTGDLAFKITLHDAKTDTTETTTGGEISDFPAVGAQEKLQVFGSRINLGPIRTQQALPVGSN